MARLRFVRRQGDVEQVRYRKRDDGQFYKHDTEAPTDLFLVEVNGKKGSLVLPRGSADGWERDGGTYWLTNKPTKGATMAARRARAKAANTRRGTKRRGAGGKGKRKPPRGFSTWSAYMASIRPKRARSHSTSSGSSGGTVAKRKRRRRSTTRRRHRRNPSVSLASNPRRRRRRSYRRNPFGGRGGIVGQATELLKEGVIGAATVVAGEAATRLIRSRVLGMTAGQTISTGAEIGIAVAGGIAVEKVTRSRQMGRDFVVGGIAGVLRATAKQLGLPLVSEALADDGPRILNGRRRVLSGYVRPRLSGYVQQQGAPALSGEFEHEIGYDQ